MKILVLNCGSSSIKYQLIEMIDEEALASGSIERIGLPNGEFKYASKNSKKVTETVSIPDHVCGIEMILNKLVDPHSGIVKDKNEIKAVGHRIVHGGEAFSASVIITKEVIETVEECCELAPLHNPANLKGIYAIEKFLPDAIQCGTFDTAFHQTLPPVSYFYPIPYMYYEKYKIRKYGFHGSSHKYISHIAAEKLGFDYSRCRIITCHLGNGASVAAIVNGKSFNTSMGFTPLEGLMMGTRSGDIDMGALLYMMKKESEPNEHIDDMIKRTDTVLNKKSGMLGVCGYSDMREARQHAEEGDEKCILALEMYTHRVKEFIGSYAAAMGGVEIVVFSGGIGENDYKTREAVCSGLEFMGIAFNYELNKKIQGEIQEISAHYSKVRVLVVPTNEELVIARETLDLVLHKLYYM